MVYILIAIAVAGVLFFVMKRSGPDISRDELQQAKERGDEMLLLDVRSEQEFKDGHVPGAVNVPHKRVLSAPNDVPAEKAEKVVVYCEHGPRAKAAQRALLNEGFTNVVHLLGDMSGWRNSGLPVEQK